tara:strand:- start:1355 stop:1606 length:252 start_codon:yes stop_codon:yes gene_type:complete
MDRPRKTRRESLMEALQNIIEDIADSGGSCSRCDGQLDYAWDVESEALAVTCGNCGKARVEQVTVFPPYDPGVERDSGMEEDQ